MELTLGECMVPLDSLGLGPGQPGPHAVVMVGIQASGKSTFARQVFEPKGYRILSMDILGHDWPDFLHSVAGVLRESHNVVLDNTHIFAERRVEAVSACRSFGAQKVTCCCFPVDIQGCLSRNANRPNAVPKVAIYSFRRRFQTPTQQEGFDEMYEIHTSGHAFAARRVYP